MFEKAMRRAVLTAWTSALGAAAVLLYAAPAQAAPCDQFGLGGNMIAVKTSGWKVVIPGSGTFASGRTTAVDPRGQSKQGNASGSISGRHVDFTITYDNGQFPRYVGDVDTDPNDP